MPWQRCQSRVVQRSLEAAEEAYCMAVEAYISKTRMTPRWNDVIRFLNSNSADPTQTKVYATSAGSSHPPLCSNSPHRTQTKSLCYFGRQQSSAVVFKLCGPDTD